MHASDHNTVLKWGREVTGNCELWGDSSGGEFVMANDAHHHTISSQKTSGRRGIRLRQNGIGFSLEVGVHDRALNR